MKKIFFKSTLFSALLLIMSSCGFFQLETAVDPNNPSLGSVANNATRNQIQSLITGLEARHRNYVFTITAERF
jgi:starch-binding outer membrane protein, SusD/RagB family